MYLWFSVQHLKAKDLTVYCETGCETDVSSPAQEIPASSPPIVIAEDDLHPYSSLGTKSWPSSPKSDRTKGNNTYVYLNMENLQEEQGPGPPYQNSFHLSQYPLPARPSTPVPIADTQNHTPIYS
jgi:hypothetical protein